MKKKITKSCLILIFIITTSCGYKVLDNQGSENYNIKEIKTSGDKRVNFKVKNSLLINSSENNLHSLMMELYTEKKKEIKEKNIKNQITKYEVSLSSYIKIIFLENNQDKEFTVTSSGNFQVADKYSTTLKNEKRLIDDLTNDISDKIKKQINLILNDL
tara:strand:- start:280 stop:756 length:477 start_codon:yes stop_codon:yes gene_type:complete